MDGNYIKINRSILGWEWYKNLNTKSLFLHMLLNANWKKGRFEGHEIDCGSYISSIKTLSYETGLTEREVRTAIDHLRMTGELTCKTTNKYTIFTVVNYKRYQVTDKQNDNQETNNRHSSDSQETNNRHSNDKLLTTIEEGKKGRKEEGKKERREEKNKSNICPAYFQNDEKLNQSFADYVLMRKEIKKPMTDRAVELAIKKLCTLSSADGTMNNDVAIEILEKSIMNSWQGLFPLKINQNQTKGVDWDSI